MSCLTMLGVEMQAAEMQAMEMYAQGHQHTQANLDGLRRFEAHCQLLLYNIEKEVQHC